MQNPYSLVFGEKPKEYVSRISQTDEVIRAFEEASQRIYMIT